MLTLVRLTYPFRPQHFSRARKATPPRLLRPHFSYFVHLSEQAQGMHLKRDTIKFVIPSFRSNLVPTDA